MTHRIAILRVALAAMVVASLSALQFLVASPTAMAAVDSPTRISIVNSELRILATPGRNSNLVIVSRAASVVIGVTQPPGGSGEFEAAAPCVVKSGSEAECPRASVTRLRVDVGDGNDKVTNALNVPSQIAMGPGDDGFSANHGLTNQMIDLGPGNDLAIPRGGSSISGGSGVDEVDYRAIREPVVVRLDNLANDGIDGGAKDNIHTDVENITGGLGDDTLIGSSSDNRIVGSTGNDMMDGGDGDDTFDIDRLFSDVGFGDLILGGLGVDTVDYSGHSADLNVSLDNMANDGPADEFDNVHSDVENVLTGEGDDTLIGTSASNVLRAGAGRDIVSGRGGNDLLDGGEDAGRQRPDWLSGGTGVDTVTYSARRTGVVVDMDDVNDDGVPGERDNVLSDVENLLGGAGNDALIGNSASNILRGLSGDDTLNGLGGNDTLEGAAGKDALFGSVGIDTATYLTHEVGVAVTLDNSANDGRSSEADNVHSDVENVVGSNLNDTIVGSSSANVLRGAAGSDRLFGRAGNDSLIGDSGVDQGFGDQGRDTCTTERKTSCP